MLPIRTLKIPRRVLPLLLGLIAIQLLGACAPHNPKSGKRFFWPLPISGVEPRIEYKGFLQSDKDLKKRDEPKWIEKAVLGEYPAVALFESPFWVDFLPDQRIAVTDSVLKQVLIVDERRKEVRPLIGLDMEKIERPYRFSLPMGIASAKSGEIFVVDTIKARVLKFGDDEKYMGSFANIEFLSHPVGVAVNDRKNLIFVSDAGQHNVAVFDIKGDLLYKIGERGTDPGQFNFPTDLDVDDQGNLYVLDTMNYRIQVFDETGQFVRSFGEQGTEIGSFRFPKGLAVSSQGHVYVTDLLSHKVIVFDVEGTHLMTLGAKHYALDDNGVVPGGFFAPRGIDVDDSGRIVIVDGVNRMLQFFQYLTEEYLNRHPIQKEDIYWPKGLRIQQ